LVLRDGTTALKVNNAILAKPTDGSWFVNAAGIDFRLKSPTPDLGASLVRKPQRRAAGGRSAKEELKLGHECIGREEWAKAYRHFESVLTGEGEEEAISLAREMMRKIDQKSGDRLKEAQALEAIGEESDARKAYLEILKEFGGLPASQQAKDRIEALKKSPAPSNKK